MPRKGHQSRKGVGDLYETPKHRVNLALTQAAIDGLDQYAKQLGVSRSELVERFGRGTVTPPEQERPAKKRKRSQQLPNAG